MALPRQPRARVVGFAESLTLVAKVIITGFGEGSGGNDIGAEGSVERGLGVANDWGAWACSWTKGGGGGGGGGVVRQATERARQSWSRERQREHTASFDVVSSNGGGNGRGRYGGGAVYRMAGSVMSGNGHEWRERECV
ncbi:cerebral cavernous malformations 2 protein-like [Eucalyptus grandis]|uniref:cerebral cavernous malformations 2 protein-like n=1 Tax=Eucalyptus grandis TaxID=71139 RepID=UPI00192EFBA6|nr:cerebral cavernous malformations 2 protein-like [Eucalyptus grandis]